MTVTQARRGGESGHSFPEAGMVNRTSQMLWQRCAAECAGSSQREPHGCCYASPPGIFCTTNICGLDSAIPAARSRFRISNSRSLFVDPAIRGLAT